MIKLIVSDIDGTLVPDGGGPEAINPENPSSVDSETAQNASMLLCVMKMLIKSS